MNIGEIGNKFSTTTKIGYDSKNTFLDFDALIIDLTFFRNQNGIAIELAEKRKRDFEEFLRFKLIPIIYLTPLYTELVTIDYQRETSLMENMSFFTPVPDIYVEAQTGKNIIVVSKTPFTEFLQTYQSLFRYEAFYPSNPSKAIAVSPHSEKVLGFYDQKFVFLPQFEVKAELERAFLERLVGAAKLAGQKAEMYPLPSWAAEYSMPKEKESKVHIQNIQHQISSLQNQLDANRELLNQIVSKKRLFTSSGDELEALVETIFKELGFEILETEKSRDDFIVKHSGRLAVVEIKGLNNSAGEKNAAQLEKWCALYLENNEVSAKGILVVNAFKETPLNKRSQPAFPDQMLKYSEGRGHCLISTVQLVSIYYAAQEYPKKLDEIIDSLFNTTGRYADTYKWSDFIEVDLQPNTEHDSHARNI